MKIFEQLGTDVDAEWRRADYDQPAFPEIAARGLEKWRADQQVTPDDLVSWVVSEENLPPQQLDSRFGDPPVIVYRNDLFFIEALFWMDGSTAVHEHSFAGAFQVLHGSSLHTQYDFRLGRKVNWRLIAGQLELRAAERLQRGDVRAIHPGSRFIHALFHLDRPSVSLVVRTRYSEPSTGIQYGYMKPHFGVPNDVRRDRTNRRSELLRIMFVRDRSRCLALLAQMLQRDDFEALFRYALTLHGLDRDAARQLLDDARLRHGELADMGLKVLEETERDALIKSRRRAIHNPEHRFFLAVLLNMPHKEAALRMVAQFFGPQPVETVMRWLNELTADGRDGVSRLGVPLSPTTLNMIEWRLRQAGGLADLIPGLWPTDELPEVQRRSIATLWEALQDNVLLRTLLTTPDEPAAAGAPAGLASRITSDGDRRPLPMS
jgi:hypothetical protein